MVHHSKQLTVLGWGFGCRLASYSKQLLSPHRLPNCCGPPLLVGCRLAFVNTFTVSFFLSLILVQTVVMLHLWWCWQAQLAIVPVNLKICIMTQLETICKIKIVWIFAVTYDYFFYFFYNQHSVVTTWTNPTPRNIYCNFSVINLTKLKICFIMLYSYNIIISFFLLQRRWKKPPAQTLGCTGNGKREFGKENFEKRRRKKLV